ncbi:proton channel OTOP1 [Xenopus tropicalis]|uniref:Otopetrin-1 gene 2 n=1 Tax=Xenopus tropicalis TaxID=8364 RepID=A0A6I8STU2_XENTR|nr:proton channel OTOP1 [Xenopus tropicalis]
MMKIAKMQNTVDSVQQEKGLGSLCDLPLPPELELEVEQEILEEIQKHSEIASSQYGINAFIIGLFLLLACSLQVVGVNEIDLKIFVTILMLIQVLWMLWYILRNSTKKSGQKEKDLHAGARWLRCGISFFALTTTAMDALKLGYFIGYRACMPLTEGVYPVAHFIHTLFQVYFLWFHSQDVIKSYKTLERFGLIHSVFTNLLLWASAVATESKHQLAEHMGRLSSLGFVNISVDEITPLCNCTTNVCHEFSKGIYYIYPFNIEYHILASAMLYVLWKNIGNHIKHHGSRKRFKLHGVAIGTILGLIVLAATIGAVFIYIVRIGRSKTSSESALTIYYWYSIIVLFAMSLASVFGLILYKLEKKPTYQAFSPSIKLDASLLVGAASASWITAWGAILALTFSGSRLIYTWFNLPYSVLVIIQKYVQNIFIIDYLYCENEHTDSITLDNIEIPIPILPSEAMVTENHTAIEAFPEEVKEEKDGNIFLNGNTMEKNFPDNNANNNSFENNINSNEKDKTQSAQRPDKATIHKIRDSPSFRKALLKNLTVFLFLCNVSLWIPPAFGCRPQYDNGLEALVYGFSPWIILVDIALPFSIFYRMHSVYSLFDVYCKI